MLAIFTKNWWVFLLRGLFAVVFGILALIWPEITLITLMFLFGVFVLLEGLLNLLIGIASSETNRRWWMTLVEGVLGIVIAILTFVYPNLTAVVLLYFIAAWGLITGVLEFLAAIRLRRLIENEWLMIINGLVSIIFALLLFIFPDESAISLVWLIGLFEILAGFLLIILSFRLRKYRDEDWKQA